MAYALQAERRTRAETAKAAPAAATASGDPAAAGAAPMQTDGPAANATPATPAPAPPPESAPATGATAATPATPGGFGSPFQPTTSATPTAGAAAATPAPGAQTPAAAAAGTSTPLASSAAPSTPTTSAPAAAAAAAPPEPTDSERQLQLSLDAARGVLRALPGALLRHPLALLAQPGLSPPTYQRAGSVLRCAADVAPSHLQGLLAELSQLVAGIGAALEQQLSRMAGPPEHASTSTSAAAAAAASSSAAAPAASSSAAAPAAAWQAADNTAALGQVTLHGASVLRLLHLLQAFRKQAAKEREQQERQQQEEQAAAAAAAAAPSGGSGGGPSGSGGDAVMASASSAEAPDVSMGTPAPPPAPAAGASSSAPQREQQPVPAEPENLAHPACGAALDGAIAQVAASLEPLWQALSGVIAHIEASLGRHGGDAAAPAAPAVGGGAASRQLPPGAQQVLPLVEAFFVVCSLQGAVPASPMELVLQDAATAEQVGGAGAQLQSMLSVGEASPAPSSAAATAAAAAAALAAGGGGGGGAGTASRAPSLRPSASGTGHLAAGKAGKGAPAAATETAFMKCVPALLLHRPHSPPVLLARTRSLSTAPTRPASAAGGAARSRRAVRALRCVCTSWAQVCGQAPRAHQHVPAARAAPARDLAGAAAQRAAHHRVRQQARECAPGDLPPRSGRLGGRAARFRRRAAERPLPPRGRQRTPAALPGAPSLAVTVAVVFAPARVALCCVAPVRCARSRTSAPRSASGTTSRAAGGPTARCA